MKSTIKYVLLGALLFVVANATNAYATHSWLNYHWARTANPFIVKLGDNLAPAWDPYLLPVSTDWSSSTVLDTIIVPGLTNSKNCKPIAGRVEMCNSKYGNNGWLGIASVWTSGDHITQGTVKMNDTYFNTTKYNKPEWKRFVMCQEVGHTFGLDHQDENFNNQNLNTCMDYTSNPLSNQQPNAHDYEMLQTIYAHLDTVSTLSISTVVSNGADIDHNDSSTWGKLIRTAKDGKASVYVKETKEGKVFTFVVWAE